MTAAEDAASDALDAFIAALADKLDPYVAGRRNYWVGEEVLDCMRQAIEDASNSGRVGGPDESALVSRLEWRAVDLIRWVCDPVTPGRAIVPYAPDRDGGA